MLFPGYYYAANLLNTGVASNMNLTINSFPRQQFPMIILC